MQADKILITGGLGFIGQETARQLVEQGRRVVLFDNLSPQIHGDSPDLSAMPLLKSSAVEFVRGDVRGQPLEADPGDDGAREGEYGHAVDRPADLPRKQGEEERQAVVGGVPGVEHAAQQQQQRE